MRKGCRYLATIGTLVLITTMLMAACGGGGSPDESEETQPLQQASPTATLGENAGMDSTEVVAEESTSSPTQGNAEPSVLNLHAGIGPEEAALSYCYVIGGSGGGKAELLVDSRLLAWTADMSEYVPEIAESWDIEGNTIILHLRENAKWHDGELLTAKDVLFTYNLIANPDTGSRYAGEFSSVVGFEEVQNGEAGTLAGLKAPDDRTVVIELSQPDSTFLAGLTWLNILPEHILGDVSPDRICEDSYWTKGRISSGPYKWVQLVEGQRIELEAFDDYFLGRPKIDKINLLFFADAATSLAAFEQGSNMVTPVTADNIEYARALDSTRIETNPDGVGALFFNTNHPDFSDVRVRQAVSYAIDRKAITESIFKGTAEPSWSELPYLEWTQSPDLNRYEYDPEKAKALLQEAGWSSDETYTLWYYYPNQVTASSMQAIQQYLGEVGINVELRLNEGGAMEQAREEGKWALIYGSLGANPHPSALSLVWTCAQEETWTYCNPEFDELLKKARRTFDREEQQQYYQEAIEILNEEAPWVWLFNRQGFRVVNEKLNTGDKNVWGPGHLGYHNYVEDWTLEE